MSSWSSIAKLTFGVAFAITLLRALLREPFQFRMPAGLHKNREVSAAIQPQDGMLEAHVLITAIKHEINQPLGAILANVDACALLWKKGLFPEEEIRHILDDIRTDVLHATHVVEKLRPLVTGRWTEPKSLIDLNEVVADTKGMLTRLAERHCTTLHLHLAAQQLPMLGDRTHLQQVILNLAANGMECMGALPSTGRVLTISTRVASPGAVALAFADRGPGIPPRRIAEMMTTFYTTKPGGVGMGIRIVKSIVDAHGGEIAFGGNEGEGAIVTVTFELATSTGLVGRRPPRA
ncbi:sensor histidine kinase [Variovorax sp. GB1R11]|uniref:sensor histidine kinase n=1 Tax=Variovorax sp. GB1R11 TaxID=3443741 RepID=UPI003F482A42